MTNYVFLTHREFDRISNCEPVFMENVFPKLRKIWNTLGVDIERNTEVVLMLRKYFAI